MAAEKIEMRGLAPTELVHALDALAHAEGQDRNAYVVSILDAHVRLVCHKQTLVARMLKGNPYLVEPTRSAPE